jgi:hypothetical protein
MTEYYQHYVRLAGERCRFSALDPFGSGLAVGDGRMGGMLDEDFDAGLPSRRELEVAAWLTADVAPELRDAQFDIATCLAKVEELRYQHGLGTRNMLEAEHLAHEYAAMLAVARLDAAALRQELDAARAEVEELRARLADSPAEAVALCPSVPPQSAGPAALSTGPGSPAPTAAVPASLRSSPSKKGRLPVMANPSPVPPPDPVTTCKCCKCYVIYCFCRCCCRSPRRPAQ